MGVGVGVTVDVAVGLGVFVGTGVHVQAIAVKVELKLFKGLQPTRNSNPKYKSPKGSIDFCFIVPRVQRNLLLLGEIIHHDILRTMLLQSLASPPFIIVDFQHASGDLRFKAQQFP